MAPEIRCREVEGRLFRGKPDRYWTLRFKLGGKEFHEKLGWSSGGWNLQRAKTVLAELKAAASVGQGAVTLRQRREEAQAKREREENAPTLGRVWDAYAETLQSRGGYRAAKSHIKNHLQELLLLKIESLRTFHLEQLKRRMESAKNKKIAYIPMTPSAEKILRDVRPTVGENSELVFGQRNAYNPRVKKIMAYVALFYAW